MFKYAVGMIVINEEEMIGRWLAQHYPHADRIIIVEGADYHYPKTAVDEYGLSMDNTAEAIRSFPDPDGKIEFIQHGWTADPYDVTTKAAPEGEGKCILRSRYCDVLNAEKFEGILWQCDADEFYTDEAMIGIKTRIAALTELWKRPRTVRWYKTSEGFLDAEAVMETFDQETLEQLVRQGQYDDENIPAGRIHAFQFPSVHFWHHPQQVICGGYFDVQHYRFFRWKIGSTYEYRGRKSHNWPTSPEGKPLIRHGKHAEARAFDMVPKDGVETVEGIEQLKGVTHAKPCCLHYGFCRDMAKVTETNEYYRARGEEFSRGDTLADRLTILDDEERKDRDLHVFPWLGPDPLHEGRNDHRNPDGPQPVGGIGRDA